MGNALTLLLRSSLLSIGVAIASSTFVPANAAFLEFSINEFTGDDAQVNLRVDEIGNDLKFSVDTNDGDLGAVFFDVADESILSSLGVTDLSLNGSATNDPTFVARANGVSRVTTGQTNITPQKFDFGVALTGGNEWRKC